LTRIIQIPNNWRPRDYQLPAWCYLENGGKHAELIWHRRSGKDEIALHWGAVSCMRRPATYWHMLPQASQARKAIWESVNPHTGIRRIDEAFPLELRATTREQEMMIKFKNGATWQVLGSDNYNSLVGSPPAGVVYSEWALANPTARAYLRPILAENNGWQMFITTPRGKNHAFKTYNAAINQPGSFSQILPAQKTSVLTLDRLAEERQSYIDDFGEDMGIALFEQEYECSFEAAIMGAVYGKEISVLRQENRIGNFPYDPEFPVHTAWDIGRSDNTSIWFYQVTFQGVRVIDYHTSSLKDVDFYIDLLRGKPFKIDLLNLPHDAKAKRLGMKRTVEEQFRDAGFKVFVLPALSIQDGIQAARKTLKMCTFNMEACDEGLETLAQYRYEWNLDRRIFTQSPVHDWTSHTADAFRYLSMAWFKNKKPEQKQAKMKTRSEMTLEELWKANKPKRNERI